jgi:hypothetical protein
MDFFFVYNRRDDGKKAATEAILYRFFLDAMWLICYKYNYVELLEFGPVSVHFAALTYGNYVLFRLRRSHYVRRRVVIETLCYRVKILAFQLTAYIHPS